MKVVDEFNPEVSSSMSRSYSLRVMRIEGRVEVVVLASTLFFTPEREFGTIGFLVRLIVFYIDVDFIFSVAFGSSRNALFG